MNTLNSNAQIQSEVEATLLSRNFERQCYEGFDYLHYESGECELVIAGKSPVTFGDFEHFKMFCDHANDIIEKVVLKDVRLHLTGCMRCRKFAKNQPGRGPCNLGVKLFEATRVNSMRIVHALLSAIENADTIEGEGTKSESDE